MRLKIFTIIATCLCLSSAFYSLADTSADLSVSKIPVELVSNANAVLRDYHLDVNIIAIDEVHTTTRIAMTILNEKGAGYARLRQEYDKFSKITSITGRLYDQDGNEIRKMKKTEVTDTKMFDMNLVDDFRVKGFNFNYTSYPYTVVFEVEETSSVTLSLPQWRPRMGHDCATEHADIEITYPKGMPLRYRTFHLKQQPEYTLENEEVKIKASIADIPARKNIDELLPVEPFGTPTLILATDTFALGEETGNMATWQDYGKFFYRLNDKRDDLPKDKKKIVHQLTDTCHSTDSKIAILYEYLKQSTRYISIQLGIGGVQTLDATFVAEKGYGDCKALSNYMKALLKETGITAYTALAWGGERQDRAILKDFTFNSFNHMILCVPQKEDTVWLECTAKTLPAGYLSSFTGNRNVLLLTPDGGQIIKTPSIKDIDNILHRTATVTIGTDDDIHADINMNFTGELWHNETQIVCNKPKSEVDNYMNKRFLVPSYSVNNYKLINNIKGKIPELNEQLSLAGSGNVKHAGKRLLLSPKIFRLTNQVPSEHEERKSSFEVLSGHYIMDTVSIAIPSGYALESLPKEIKIEYPFGTYSAKVVAENSNTIKINSCYYQKKGIYPATDFANYLKFCKDVNTGVSDIMLTKKD